MRPLTRRLAAVTFVIKAFVVIQSLAHGQITVDPDRALWAGGATNPSGEHAVPIFQYRPDTGDMWLSTVGLNRVSDTTSNSTIGGDDVAIIAISVESPRAVSTSSLFDGFHDGVFWQGDYFNGKQQLFGTSAGAEFLRPTEGTVVWTFEPGLTDADFGTVELGICYGVGPGGTIFGGVQIDPVPEPASWTLLTIAAFALVSAVRRTKGFAHNTGVAQ